MQKSKGASLQFMLNVNERLKENLTTKQIIVVLNALINKACKPIFHKSFYMRACVLQTVLQTQDDHRRKIAVADKLEASNDIINAVAFNRYSFIEHCELNRSILYNALRSCLSAMEGIEELERNQFIKSKRIQSITKLNAMSKKTGIPLYEMLSLYRWSSFYLDAYIDFKSMIMEKYVRESFNQAKFDASRTDLWVDVEDITENYMLAVSKAIDKCDAGQGTLTSYIKKWMLSARNNPEFSHEHGIAYDIPAPIRKKKESNGEQLLNMSASLSDSFDKEDEGSLDGINGMFNCNEELLFAFRGLKNAPLLFMGLGIAPPLTEDEFLTLGKTAL